MTATTRTTSGGGGRLRILLRWFAERFRLSLFGVPVLWVVGGVVTSQLATWIDVRIADERVPSFLDTTVESARSILAAISSGTIGAASVVFSLTLVAIQMSTSAYSSRVLRSFLRDRFQQHMIGILLGTFTYSLLVLREVRGPLEDSGTSYLPRISVFLAVLLALAAVLALLGSINHTAQSLRSSSIVSGLVGELVDLIERNHAPRAGSGDDDSRSRWSVDDAPTEQGAVLTSVERGYVQQVSLDAIRERVDSGSTIRLEVAPGDYVAVGVPLLTLWPRPELDIAEHADDLRGAFVLGVDRTLQHDIRFGFIMLEDVASRALSPGVNDPNTAIEVIEHLGEPVLALLERDLGSAPVELDGCRFIQSGGLTDADVLVVAFNRIRHDAIDAPGVQLAIVKTLIAIADELRRRGRSTPSAIDAIRSVAGLVEADLDPDDADPQVRTAGLALRQADWTTSPG